MTKEEALQAIKEKMDYYESDKRLRGAIETLIPELSESVEDENLKNKSGYYKAGKFWKASTLWNATKDKIPQRVSNRYILQGCTWNIGSLQEFANEVKNVQEVSLDYPIILDMNGNILDGAHRVVKAYLEDKDIDIVYLGDDEWPEPDYDEEKAVKESKDERIIRAIIDALYSHTNSINLLSSRGYQMEDIEAWLEKQKENSKLEDSWHRVTDSFPDSTREVICKDAIGNFFIGRYYKGNNSWEVSIYDDINKSNEDNPPVVMWCDIPSEKQKEQKPELPKPHKGDDNNPYDMSVSEAQEYAINRGFGIPFNDGEVYVDERHITQTIGNILRWADEHPKEQKPVEYLSKEKVFAIMKKLTSLSFCVPLGSDEEKQIDEITCDVRSLLDYPIEQKPAEWSEEDEKMLRTIISDGSRGVELDSKQISFLKSLRPSWKPSKEQMEALWKLMKYAVSLSSYYDIQKEIESLYNDLNKLK